MNKCCETRRQGVASCCLLQILHVRAATAKLLCHLNWFISHNLQQRCIKCLLIADYWCFENTFFAHTEPMDSFVHSASFTIFIEHCGNIFRSFETYEIYGIIKRSGMNIFQARRCKNFTTRIVTVPNRSETRNMFATIYFSLENIRDKSIFASFADLYIFI